MRRRSMILKRINQNLLAVFPLLPFRFFQFNFFVSLFKSGPAVPNAYNYDPMQEITKLGTGQLRSTYRKSQYVSF